MNGSSGNSGFGWMLVIVGLGHRRDRVDLGSGSQSAETGAAPRRYRHRKAEQPVLLPDRDVHRDQCRAEPCDLADPSIEAVIRRA